MRHLRDKLLSEVGEVVIERLYFAQTYKVKTGYTRKKYFRKRHG